MKKLVSVLLAVSAVAVAAPAFAGGQHADRHGYNDRDRDRAVQLGHIGPHSAENIRDKLDRIDRRIERARHNREISHREAQRLNAEVTEARRLNARYRVGGGLTAWEKRDLDRRIERLRAHLRWERNDGDNWRDEGPRDRDHDGRYDRYEDDRGARHDPR